MLRRGDDRSLSHPAGSEYLAIFHDAYHAALRHLKQALAMRQALNRRDGNGTSGAQAGPTHDPEVVAIMHEMGIALAKSGDRVQAVQ